MTTDFKFKDVLKKILNQGAWYMDGTREDTARLQIPSYTFRHEFKGGFPALRIKELKWNSVVTELIWFLRGDQNIKYLVDNKNPIWNKDAYNWYKRLCKRNGLNAMSLKAFVKAIRDGENLERLAVIHGGLPNENDNYKLGDVGQNYSRQWRSYNGQVDQIVKLIKDMKENIMSTRLKVEAWNPAEVGKTALPPCHTGFQIVGVPMVEGGYGFELHWNQRSVDTFLGLPFNIASYALFSKILEELTGFKALAIQGDLKCVHLYDNAIEVSRELLKRTEFEGNVDLDLNLEKYRNLTFDQLINKVSPKDFILKNYASHEAMLIPMKAPKR